jgi:hypothetical protein
LQEGAIMTIDSASAVPSPEMSLDSGVASGWQRRADLDENGAPPKSSPPPLPAAATLVPPQRAAADDAFAESMIERLASGDYEGAALAARALLEYRPRDSDALDCAQIAESELRKTYIARLGSLDRIPRVAMGPDAILSLQALDFRAGYLLSRVDGTASLDGIVWASSLPSLEVLRVLSELYLRRVIALD